MFKFDFDIEEDEELDFRPQAAEAGPSRPSAPLLSSSSSHSSHEVSLDALLTALPETILYSPVSLPFLTHPVLRRDLHDARFQLAASEGIQSRSRAAVESQGDSDRNSTQHVEGEEYQDAEGEEYVDAEGDEYVDAETDLIKGVYEGGLKTWEGGMDLLQVLSELATPEGGIGEWVRGSRVLEVGCGTALPSAYILHSLLASSPTGSSRTTLHLQDYNLAVLRLVTLPNLLLASLPYLPPSVLQPPDDTEEGDMALTSQEDPHAPASLETGELRLTGALKNAFVALLKDRGVHLRFTYGHWAGLAQTLRDEEAGAGLVLTSETIYEEASVADLISVLRAAASPRNAASSGKHPDQNHNGDPVATLGERVERVGLDRWRKVPLSESGESLVLVAAKVLYFGVGGGLQSFLSRVEADAGWWEGVKEWTKGVGRKVVRVGW